MKNKCNGISGEELMEIAEKADNRRAIAYAETLSTLDNCLNEMAAKHGLTTVEVLGILSALNEAAHRSIGGGCDDDTEGELGA